MMMNASKKKGFTMIELLVSLAIIAMLFTTVVVLFNELKEKSRDTRRISDVREINKALALYANTNGKFPISFLQIVITGEDIISETLETAGVITEMPSDPIHPVNTYTYQTDSEGNTFIISFCLETNTIPNYSQGCGNIIKP